MWGRCQPLWHRMLCIEGARISGDSSMSRISKVSPRDMLSYKSYLKQRSLKLWLLTIVHKQLISLSSNLSFYCEQRQQQSWQITLSVFQNPLVGHRASFLVFCCCDYFPMDILDDIFMSSDPHVQTSSVKKFGNCSTVLKDLIYKKTRLEKNTETGQAESPEGLDLH